MIDLVTVVFRDELDFLKIQARSLDLYANPADVDNIYIVINDQDDVCDLIDTAWWGCHKNVKLIPYSKWNYVTRVNGWENQQLCKLLAAAESGSSWSMVLDAKTWLIQPLVLDKLFNQRGQPTVGFQPVVPVFQSSKQFVEQYYNISMTQVIGPAGVPFMFHTNTVKEMIEQIDDFVDFFQTHVRFPHFLTEFHLYSGFVLHRHGTYEHLYDKNQYYRCHNIADFDVVNFDQEFNRIKLHPQLLTASIHRRAYPLLSEQQLINWQQFLLQKKLNIVAILGDRQLWHSTSH
jgi:hypothetical protein